MHKGNKFKEDKTSDSEMDSSTKIKKDEIKRRREKLKSNSTRKFLSCFKPADVDRDPPLRLGRSRTFDSLTLGYVSIGDGKEGVEFSKFLDSSSSSESRKGGGRNKDLPPRKKTGRRKLANFFKTETKINRKKQLRSSISDSKILEKLNNIPSLNKGVSKDENERSISSVASSSSSRSTSTHSMTSNDSQNKQEKSNEVHAKGFYSSNCCLCLILTSLFVLIFFGRICAIFFTSSWFFLVPRWGRGFDSIRTNVLLQEIDNSTKNKKKDITKGILEKHHSRLV